MGKTVIINRAGSRRRRIVGMQIFWNAPALKSDFRERREAESLQCWHHVRLPTLELAPHFAPKISNLGEVQRSQAVSPHHGAGGFFGSLLRLIAKDQLNDAAAGHGLLWIVSDLKQLIWQLARLVHSDPNDRCHDEDRTEFSVG
jgi:hypothetical protein